MMAVFKKLAADGLVKRYAQPGSPRDRWELTENGTIILKSAKPSVPPSGKLEVPEEIVS